ncbi:ribonuclease III [Patescibacteria group bacterium]|nr:ribonuclease III [Patescibacteria group bacterium]MBU0777089.1 ribonuclease III [Patescibacteria group bacterium]MBU0845783.1 ribonuclease III [Patescibacteria group bacterium]MBU0922810.1 ribonuclease III [Patescibacteria group bacterium]MBU1066457.1 ribonuclease III [Patescibacteria group bacterium]
MTQAEKLTKVFKDQELLEQAFTHKSWVNENKNKRKSNERLEFLGDAILEFIVSREIYLTFPNKEEGYLTTLRSNLVNTKNLAHVAEKLGIGEKIYLSRGEEDGGGRKNSSLLADTLEAVIGALFLDQGMDTVYEFIKEHLLSEVPEKISKPLKDAKSRLQEYVQSQGHPAPIYKVIKASGPDHNKNFIVEVLVAGKRKGQGTGKNKSSAAQAAAENVLNNAS